MNALLSIVNFRVKGFILSAIVLCTAQITAAQCGSPISIFPYNEDFEINDGSWTPGGTGSDWAWGTPSKPVISGAGSGAKCWVIGGLTGSSYTNSEASWLKSPCLDFSSLQYPYIKFKVFWEMERRFDGANLQYSTDLGVSWTNVGTVNDPVNCLNENWYNFNPITYIASMSPVRDGWSGNIQATAGSCQGTGGSGAWVTAQHCMPALAGQPNVIFRFIFGAGTVCNSYDGFAVDDITISEAPPNNASFTYSCTNSNTVSFTNTSALCPNLSWDFGDLASGSNNTSALQNPVHVFSAPGNYTITLTATGPSNAPSTSIQFIHILGVATNIITPLNCFGDNNGSISATVIPPEAAPFTYTWNTAPVQNTPVVTGLSAGTYTVTVDAANSCTTTATVILSAPAVLSHVLNIIQPGCAAVTGTATVIESGGTPPYTYSWSPSGGTGATASGLAPGNYTVTVTDNNFCLEIINITIASATTPSASISGSRNISCFGSNDGTATATASGGNAPYSFSWNTLPVQNTAMATGLAPGNYTATITDNNGCTATANVLITQPRALNASPGIINESCGLKNGSINITATGGTSPYQYLWTPTVSVLPTANNLTAGNYSVRVTDTNNCLVSLNNISVVNNGTPVSFSLGKDSSICSGQNIFLNPGPYAAYLWQDNSTLPVFAVTQTGKYWVKVTSSAGCTGSDTVNITAVVGCDDIYLPNTFTPNGDGNNDFFGPVGNVSAASAYRLVIYDRWGELVFSSSNPYEKWDGKFSGMFTGGTESYAWYVTYTFKGQYRRTKKGMITVMK